MVKDTSHVVLRCLPDLTGPELPNGNEVLSAGCRAGHRDGDGGGDNVGEFMRSFAIEEAVEGEAAGEDASQDQHQAGDIVHVVWVEMVGDKLIPIERDCTGGSRGCSEG